MYFSEAHTDVVASVDVWKTYYNQHMWQFSTKVIYTREGTKAVPSVSFCKEDEDFIRVPVWPNPMNLL
jgi:hypothetical protein